MLLTLGAAIVVLGVLIFVHELGHFMAAKSVGIGVPRFSIGLGPITPLRFKRGETEYVISWIPFGGYVKMASREEQEELLEGGISIEEYPPEKLFENKPLWARVVVISAGVAMNAAFAVLLHFFVAYQFGRVEDPTVTIAEVDAATLPAVAARLAELPFGTRVSRINGDSVNSWNDIIGGIMEPTSDRLRIDFFEGVDPVIVPVPGVEAETRAAIMRSLRPLREARIGTVVPGQPAAKGGVESQDLVVRADGDSVRYWQELVDVVERNIGNEITLQVVRGDSLASLQVTPREETVIDPVTQEEEVVGRIGIGVHLEPRYVEYTLGEAVTAGFERTARDGGTVWFALKGLVSGGISPRELGGPILIGQISGAVARVGLEAFLGFMAFFSINLAILNLLPIPVLDGGHLVFLLVEGVRGKPVSSALRMRLSQVGLTLLLGIMLFAFANDILRVFGL